MFIRVKRKSSVLVLNIVANQRVPTNAALILRKVESLLLRHIRKSLEDFCAIPRYLSNEDENGDPITPGKKAKVLKIGSRP